MGCHSVQFSSKWYEKKPRKNTHIPQHCQVLWQNDCPKKQSFAVQQSFAKLLKSDSGRMQNGYCTLCLPIRALILLGSLPMVVSASRAFSASTSQVIRSFHVSWN